MRKSHTLLALLGMQLAQTEKEFTQARQELFFAQGGGPIFIPRKHTKQTYRSQQRLANQKRKAMK